MSAFEFKALDAQGKKQSGIFEANTLRQVRQQLRDRGWAPLSVVESHKRNTIGTEPDKAQATPRGGRLSVLELALITRQMAMLIQSGLTIDATLQAIAGQTDNLKTRGLLLSVRAAVLEGQSLADAMATMPQAFSKQYRMTVAAGELTARLAEVMEKLAIYSERQHKFRQEVQIALYYPIILLFLALAIMIGLVTFVVPQIVEVFADSATELPFLTRMVIGISQFMQQYLLWLVPAIFVLVVGLRQWLKQPKARLRGHQMLLDMPFIGRYIRDTEVARFTSTLAILVHSSAPLLDALKVARDVVNNLIIKAAVLKAVNDVSEGGHLHVALRDTGQFPSLLLQMIASGETGGRLSEMLESAANYQEQSLARRIATLVKLFEPAMLVIMGGLVMLIVIAILLPILQFNQLVT